jgi:hypothetical protein
MLDFFQLILDTNLELQDSISILAIFNLLYNFGGIGVKASFEQALCMIQFV